MITYVILGFCALFLAFVIANTIAITRTLNRRRQLTCPDCHAVLTVPSISPLDLCFGGKSKPGFTLHCAHCSADYRFTFDCQLVGRVAPSS